MAASDTGRAPLLEIADLSVNYGGIHAREELSLGVHAGEVVTLIGANGAGKSTTLRSISRLLPVRRGRIVYGGQEIGRLRPDEVVRRGIAQVPEGRRMLALARALMSRPQLLLLDEPSLGLAPLVVRAIFGTIRELHAAGVTILLVEQNAHAALQIADRGYVLEAGRLAMSGPAASLLSDDRGRRAYLG